MTDVEVRASGLSRRSFLKGSLAASALAVGGSAYLTGCAPKSAGEGGEKVPETGEPVQVDEEIYSGVCRGNCYGGCFLNVHVRDGKVVRTSARDLPEPEWNRICSKGLSHVFRIYDPERVKYPMRRVGERGAGEWEQISWDEALTEMAEKFQGYIDEFGPTSVCYWYGSGNDSFANNINRFMNHIGGTKVFQQLDMALFYATMKSVGVGMNFNGNEMSDLKNAKTVVVWGSNPAVSQMQGMHFLMEARDAGTKVIAIDPVYSATVAKCDEWVPIATGTDGLLAMAIMNVIIEKGWQDTAFMKASTVAPFLVKESDGKYLRLSDLGQAEAGSEADAIVVTDGSGTFDVPDKIADPVIEGTFDANGQKATCAYSLLLERLAQYPVEEASRQCDVPVETIEHLAEALAVDTPATIYMCLGLDHYQNGFYSMFDICCIPALTGSAGKPGAFTGSSESLFYFYTNPENPYGLTSEGAVGMKYTIPCNAMNEVMDTKTFLGEHIEPKALWVFRSNLLSNMCQRQYTKEWLDKIEYLVVGDINFNENARYADLLLPVCHWFEQEDFGATYPQNPFIEYQEKAIDPLYESKSDFDIVRELADKMGFGDQFDFTPGDFFDEEMKAADPSLGLSYAAIKEQKAIRGLPGSAEAPFVHGAGGVFPTATGRLQFYEESPAPNTDFGQSYDLSNETLPYWEPPREVAAGRTPNEKYPLQILSDHQKLRTHTQWINIAPILELDPEPTVKLHPDTAAERNIAEGDTVRIFNDRGYVVMRAHLSEGVRPDVLLCSRGWDQNQYIDGNLQDVLQIGVHPVCVTQAFFDAIGNIEKVEA